MVEDFIKNKFNDSIFKLFIEKNIYDIKILNYLSKYDKYTYIFYLLIDYIYKDMINNKKINFTLDPKLIDDDIDQFFKLLSNEYYKK